jgi:hypothetical protein
MHKEQILSKLAADLPAIRQKAVKAGPRGVDVVAAVDALPGIIDRASEEENRRAFADMASDGVPTSTLVHAVVFINRGRLPVAVAGPITFVLAEGRPL